MLLHINCERCCHVNAGLCAVKAVECKSGQWDYEGKMRDKGVIDKQEQNHS